MKKKIKYLLFIIILTICLMPNSVFAASAKFNVGTSSHSVTIGQTFTVTVTASSDENIMSYEYMLSYNKGIIQLVSGNEYNHSEPSGGTSESKSFTFKAIASGNTTVSLTGYMMGTQSKDFTADEITLSPTSNIASNAATSAPPTGGSSSGSGSSSGTANYSTNNNLATLTIDGQTIEPAFNKDVTDYTISLDESVEKIKITGTPEDTKSTITGLGEQTLDLGENKYQITVTSEKGTTKTYTITVNVEDKNPVTTIIDGKTYTIIKKASLLKAENDYKASTIKINNIEVPCLKNEKNNYILVGLKDENGLSGLYLYNEETKVFKSYIKITFNALSLTIIDNDFNNKGYSKFEEIINDIKVNTYKTSESSNYGVFYALNNTTNEEGYYMYDKENNSVIKYNNEESSILNARIDKARIIIISLAAATLIFAVALIIVAKKKNKKDTNKTTYNILNEKDIKQEQLNNTQKKKNEKTESDEKKLKEMKTQEVDLEKIELEKNLKLKDKKAIKNKVEEEIKQEKIESFIKKEVTEEPIIKSNKQKKKKTDKDYLKEW